MNLLRHSLVFKEMFSLSRASRLLLGTLGVGAGISVFAVNRRKIEGTSALPSYDVSEISKHRSKETRIWVTYQGGVYDVTDFVEQHPGGDKILLAAGGSLEPFWAVYQTHSQAFVKKLLEQYRIGNTSQAPPSLSSTDAYGNEPHRLAALKIVSAKPFNAETPLVLLAASFITPNEFFFVRNHLPVPVVDPRSYRLTVSGEGIKEKSYGLEELKQFPRKTITATLQCSGNRRTELNTIKMIKGLEWSLGAIGNAEWTGVSLLDVLKDAGYKPTWDPTDKIRHVEFEGLDQDTTGAPYAVSIPIEKVVIPTGDVMLAFEMNGQELPRDHGFPVRALVPGHTGARSVKWLSKVILKEKECEGFWQQKDYKSFNPSVDWNNVDWSSAPSIQESPIQSAICEPVEGETVSVSSKSPTISVRGFAFSGGGRSVQRVDVSADGGKTWQTADLQPNNQRIYQAWSWNLWTCEVKVSENVVGQPVQLVARAVDNACNVQPSDAASLWNLRGVMNNVWHRVNIKTEA